MTRTGFIRIWFERSRAQVLLVFLVVCMFTAIEIKHPLFFLHGDNLQQILPYYVHNVRSILLGEIPLFDFHQFLGTPLLSGIQSVAFYPPNYIAVILSQLIRGDYYATIEIVTLFHLVIAILGFFKLMRYFGLSEWSCCFGAIAWTFCGFVLTVGASWVSQPGYAAYLPLILLYSLRQMFDFNLKNFVILVGLRVLDLILSNPSYHLYSIMFDFLTVLILYFVAARNGAEINAVDPTFQGRKCSFFVFATRQGINYLCVALVAAPFLLPVLHQIGLSADRKAPLTLEYYSANGYDWLHWLNGVFTPFNTKYYSWCEQPYISHIGWLTLLFCIAAFWQKDTNRKLVVAFTILAIFSFLWASGTIVTNLFYYIPFYNRQRYPFKLAFFTSFFLIMVASFGFDYWYQRVKVLSVRGLKVGTALLALAIVFHVGNFAAFHLSSPQRIFIQHYENVPYDEPLKEVLKDGRMVSIVPAYEIPQRVSFTMPVLGFNYATLFGLYHFAGYETLVSDKNLMASKGLNYSADFQVDKGATFNPSLSDLEYFRKWGVKWYVVDKKVLVDYSGILKLVHNDDKRVVMLDAAALPFVYWQDSEAADGVSHSFSTNSIRAVTDRQTSGQLIANVLYNPFFKATIDGDKAEITETSDMQMLVTVPPGKHAIKITYSDPYFTAGLLISGGFFAFVVIGGLFYRDKVKRRPHLSADLLEKAGTRDE